MKIYVFGHLDIFFGMIDFLGIQKPAFAQRTQVKLLQCLGQAAQRYKITRPFPNLIFFHFQNFSHFVQSLLFGNLYSLQIKQYLLHLSVRDVCLNLVNPEIATINPRHAQKSHRKNFVCPRCFHRNGEDGVQFVRSLPTISIFKYSQSGRDCCHHHVF